MRRTFTAELLKLNEMINFIKNEVGKMFNSNDPFLNKVHIISEEILTNIIHYAYIDNNIINELEINCSILSEREIQIDFIDSGKPFDIISNHKSIKHSDDDIGGFGLDFIFKLSKDVKYTRTHRNNVVSIIIETI